MNIDMSGLELLKERIDQVEWFSHCGEKNEPHNVVFPVNIITKNAAVKSFSSTKWGNIQLEENNKLTEYLFKNYRDMYNSEYNLLVKKIKEEYIFPLDELVMGRCKELFNDKAHECLDELNWDILSLFVHEYFKKYYLSSFYSELFKVFEAGHIPCNWDGKYPDGRLMVF